MNKIVFDDVLRSRLGNLTHPVELCDESGRVLARILPTDDISQWEPITPDVTEEELSRRARSDERRYSTKEVLDYLENL